MARGAWRALLGLCLGLWLPAFAAGPGVSPQAMHHYVLLEQARTRYAALATQDLLTRLPPLPARAVRAGEPYAGAPALRRLLVAVGDLPAGADQPDPSRAGEAAPDTTLDEALVEGLRRFQERHGLEADGVLGGGTWRALTTPLSARLRQIDLTLQRWRALPANPHRRALFINIPRFRLYAMPAMDEHEADMLQIDVVVGRAVERLRTPTFSADLTHVIFRPQWDVPRSIAMQEIVPAARKEAGYFARHHYELVDRQGRVVPYAPERLEDVSSGALRIRQQPGGDNALGAVKFVMPNPHDVYLHDTPARTLFARTTRAYSHGCIRVGDPAALARFVLADDPSWTAERIEAAMQGEEPLRVNLKEPIRVYIVYGTAIAREDGSVLFLQDLYGLEKP